MKRYTLTDHKTGEQTDYSNLEWNVALWLLYFIGILIGALIFK